MYSEVNIFDVIQRLGDFPKRGVFEFIKQSSMKQMEDFVLIFEVYPKWNISKCKRLLGLDQEKLKQGVANILTDSKDPRLY